jgi:hypothetical protein
MYLCLLLINVNYGGASPYKERCIFVQLVFPLRVLVLRTVYDCENKRSGISNERDNLHKILFKNSKAAFDAHDMLKNISCSPVVYNSQTLLGIHVPEWGQKFG